MPTLDADAVAAILRHMNDDHRDDSLHICRWVGSQPDASAAHLADLDDHHAHFVAEVDGAEVTVSLPWASSPLASRAQVREEMVTWTLAAHVAAGTTPPAHG